MNKKAYLLLAFIMLASAAIAARFDCSKASTNVEKLACPVPTLAKMDQQLSENRLIRLYCIDIG